MSDKLRGGTTIGGYLAWHAGNMGSGSTIDADLLDGVHGSGYASVLGRVINDCNDAEYRVPGMYGFNADPLNCPAASSYASMIVAANLDTGFQIVGGHSTQEMWFRGWSSTGATYHAWRKVLSDTNYNSYSPTLTGTGASGSWAIDITGSSASCTGNSLTSTSILVSDTRDDGDVVPAAFPSYSITGSFTDEVVASPNTWDGVLTLKAWSGNYQTWQLMSNAGVGGTGDTNLYFRTGNTSTWGALEKVWTSGNDGTGSGLDADTLDGLHASDLGGGITWSITSTNTTMAVGNGYFADTTGGAITLTLPATATLGASVGVADYDGSFETNTCTVARNGHNIMGVAENFSCDIDNLSIVFVYVDATQGWRIVDTTGTGGGGGGLSWVSTLSDITAVQGYGYMVDTSSGALTLTLPLNPVLGYRVGYKDLNATFGDFPLTIDRNGELIEGASENLKIDSDSAAGELVYSGAIKGWLLTSSTPLDTVQSKPMMHVQDQKPTGTHGGTSVVGDNDRDLNTVLINDIAGASLGTNTVTLPAGQYYVEALTEWYCSSDSAYRSHCVAYIKTASSDTLLRGVNKSYSLYQSTIPVAGVITLTTATAIKVVLGIANSGLVTNGLGSAGSLGDHEVYTDLRIWQLDGEKIHPKVYQPINQPITGAYTVGNIFGGSLVHTGTNIINVEPYSCYSDDLTTALYRNVTTGVNLGTTVLNTIYHIFAVLDGGVQSVSFDTDIDGAGLAGTITKKRWLGYVRTNSSNTIADFYMLGDEIRHVLVTESVYRTASTSRVVLDLSSLLPEPRIRSIFPALTCSSGSTANLTTTYYKGGIDGRMVQATINPAYGPTVNWNVSTIHVDTGFIPFRPGEIQVQSSSTAMQDLIKAVRLWR